MAITTLIEFAVSDDYYFDQRVGRYRYRSSNRFAPRAAILNLTRLNIEEQSRNLRRMGDRLSSGEITLRQFQRESAETLKRIHVQQAILGRGGIDRMTSEDWLTVGRELRRQYGGGIDPETGQRYGLKWLAQDIQQGRVSPAQLNARLDMFAQSGKVSYFEMERQSMRGDRPFGRRLLGAAEHCRMCPIYAGRGIQPIDQLVLPTRDCPCRTRCKCTIQYLTLEEAIAQGASANMVPGFNLDERINETELNRRRDALVELYGEEKVATAERNMQAMINNSTPNIRLSTESVEKVIASGRFKTTLELAEEKAQGNKGENYNSRRTQVERTAFNGYYDSRPAADRPIYGYFGGTKKLTDESHSVASMYGDTIVRLNPDVRSRITVATDDTFLRVMPTNANNVNAGALRSDMIEPLQRRISVDRFVEKTGTGYLEFQVHGQLRANDIAEIIVDDAKKITPAIRDWAAQSGAKITVNTGMNTWPSDAGNFFN